MNRTQCHISLAPDFANLPILERFIGRCAFLEKEESLRMLIIATEYFENIVSYSKSPIRAPVEFRIAKNGAASIRIRYATFNFTELTRAAGTVTPHYDRASLRYRGLGLRMCANLSSSIQYEKGLFKSSVIIIL